MSRQEVYAWASLLSNLAFALIYIVLVFGIPSIMAPWEGDLIQALALVIFVDLVFQTIITLQQRRDLKIEKDERDKAIEAEGFRVGYYVFLVAVAILIGHLYSQTLIESFADPAYLARMKSLPLHFLVIVLIAGTSAKPIVQIRRYRA